MTHLSIPYLVYEAMFDRIVVNVVEMRRIILIIANCVLPLTTLPDTLLAFPPSADAASLSPQGHTSENQS
jgi:hypothetical protein